MPQLRFSARAQADIARLHQFLNIKNELAAKRAVLAIRAAILELQHFPMIGRPIEDDAALCELVIDFGASGYLALYHFEPTLDTVTILAVKHQREDDYR